jgi:two-component system response regulator DevR
VTTRVFLVDDHEIVRSGLRTLLESSGEFSVVGEAGTAAETLRWIPAARPQVAILDLRLPDGDGVEVCRELRSRWPEVACLMLTSYSDDEALFAAILAGASGYLLKQIRSTEIVDAVRRVAAGESLLDPTLTDHVLARLRSGPSSEPEDELSKLTPRETRVLELIAEGKTNREIGAELFLAEKTVKNYVSNLLAKLGMHRRTEAAVLATERRLNGQSSAAAERRAGTMSNGHDA